MKKYLLIISMLFSGLAFQSCSPKIVTKSDYVSAASFMIEKYGGKDKSYIIEEYPYPITEIKRLDEQYEILVFRRYRNELVGYGYTNFYMKNGLCYEVKTNEYMKESKTIEVSFFEWLFGLY